MIAGYCWPQSALPGETVTIFTSADAATYSLAVARVGREAQSVFKRAGLPGLVQVMPDDPGANGCNWQPTFELEIDPAWPSGLYLVRFTDDRDKRADAFFVVRSTEPLSAMIVLATSTWSAYNTWGGPSFYTGAHTSSAQRPLGRGFLAQDEPGRFRVGLHSERTTADIKAMTDARLNPWCLCAGWANWEHLFVRWAEAEGLQLGYAISQDLDRDPDLLSGYPAYVSAGHDEYWSAGMRNTVEDYVDAGGNAAFFSGNVAFWQARFEDNYSRVVSYKTGFRDDPLYTEPTAPDLSTMWSDPLVGRPENEMTGVTFTRGGYARMPNSPRGSGGYTVHRPDHWAFDSTGLNAGDVLGADGKVVAYECDGCELELRDGLPVPTGNDGTPTNFEILGSAPAHLWLTEEAPTDTLGDDFIGELNWVAERIGGADTTENRQRYTNGHAVLGTFHRGRGEVFTTGCTDWAYGLGSNDVATVTRNVMTRFIRGK